MIAFRIGNGKLIAPVAALTLAACGGEQAEPTYEADVEDRSGELIVSDPSAPAIPVDLPETPMTSVPVDEANAASDASTPAADSAAGAAGTPGVGE